ncbi:MAG: response regulator [Gammaproteobacteria bacterium]|nr:response regulator [Gammaproteobacteria bacterium]NNF61493.1 response regulator [Gammaproteobacteria bacterium]NNM20775.1 response regulator [Gammaproteobacteria bacterium]
MNDSAAKKRSIAIVEDNPDNLLLLRVLLQDLYTLQEYPDGVLAVEGIVASPPDLVLMDISLPRMDGVEALRGLRRHGLKSLPVVALTAHAMVGDRERFLAEGFDYYIAKPILDRAQVIEPIEQLLAGLDVT